MRKKLSTGLADSENWNSFLFPPPTSRRGLPRSFSSIFRRQLLSPRHPATRPEFRRRFDWVNILSLLAGRDVHHADGVTDSAPASISLSAATATSWSTPPIPRTQSSFCTAKRRSHH